eukprot:Sspe_Gene.265::Locus_88_Transcript_1_1_Confidence_1.000_Length_1942::g.265::m.265
MERSLCKEEVLVELHVVELHIVHVPVQARVPGHQGVHEVRGPLLVEHGDEPAPPTMGMLVTCCPPTESAASFLYSAMTGFIFPATSLHRLVLSGRPDTAHGQTDVHSGPLPTSEELRVKVDLPVRDGDHVRHDVRRHVVRQGLDDGEGRQRPTTHPRRHHGRTLQQTGVQVEHVTRVGLTPKGKAAAAARALTVGHGLLRQIVVHHKRVPPSVTELLADGHPREGGKVLQPSGVGSRGGHDNRENGKAVVQRQQTVDTRNVRAPLPNAHVHGDPTLFFSRVCWFTRTWLMMVDTAMEVFPV